MTFLTQRRGLAAKVESTKGTDAGPTLTGEGIPASNPQDSPQLGTTSNDETRSTITRRPDIPTGGGNQHTYGSQLRGPGTSNAGSVPLVDPLLKACRLQVQSVDSEITGTAQSVTMDSITLAAGDGSNVFVGATINYTPTSSWHVITAISTDTVTVYPSFGSSPTTGDYTVPVQQSYQPASTSLDTITSYIFKPNTDGTGIISKLVGGRGNVDITMNPQEIGQLSFTMQGKLLNDEGADPGGDVPIGQNGPVFVDGIAVLDDTSVRSVSFQMSTNNQITTPPDPRDTFGVDLGIITSGLPGGSLTVPKSPLSNRDPLQNFIDGKELQYFQRAGDTAGNRVNLWVPALVQSQSPSDTDQNGLTNEPINFQVAGDLPFALTFD